MINWIRLGCTLSPFGAVKASSGLCIFIYHLELGELITVVFAADLHDFGNKGFIRILGVQELLDCPELLCDVPWILFFEPVDEVLEIITIPLVAEPFHDVYPVSGLTFPVLGKLVITSFPLTEQMGADEVQVIIIDIDPASGDLVLYGAVSVFAGDRVPAGLIQHIRHAFHLEGRKAAGGRLIDRREQLQTYSFSLRRQLMSWYSEQQRYVVLYLF